MTAPMKDPSPERESIANVLRMRAWIGHIVVSVQKLGMLLLGANGWDIALTARKDIEHNVELYDKLEPFIRYAMFSIIIFGLILDLLCIKSRRFADGYLYLELTNFLVYSLIPMEVTDNNALYGFGPLMIAAMSAGLYIVHFRSGLITTVLYMMAIEFVTARIAKNSTYTTEDYMRKLTGVLALTIAICLLAAVETYIQSLQQRIRF